MKLNKILGILFTVIGAVGEIYALMTIYTDMNASILYGRYTYAPPFTEHEITYIAIATVAAAILVLGLMLLLVKRNKTNK